MHACGILCLLWASKALLSDEQNEYTFALTACAYNNLPRCSIEDEGLISWEEDEVRYDSDPRDVRDQKKKKKKRSQKDDSGKKKYRLRTMSLLHELFQCRFTSATIQDGIKTLAMRLPGAQGSEAASTLCKVELLW